MLACSPETRRYPRSGRPASRTRGTTRRTARNLLCLERDDRGRWLLRRGRVDEALLIRKHGETARVARVLQRKRICPAVGVKLELESRRHGQQISERIRVSVSLALGAGQHHVLCRIQSTRE